MSTALYTIRHNIARRTQQPFFRDLGVDCSVATSGSTTTLVDTVLLGQADDTWKKSFIYFPSSREVRKITSLVSSTKTVSWVGAIATAVVSGREYEIWSQFTPLEVHDAINQALRDAWPFFFDAQEKFIVIQNDEGTDYTISSLSPAPRFLSSVAFETFASSFTGTVTTVTTTVRLKDTARTFVAADVGKSVRIYEGTSKGDQRTISALIDANTIEVSVAWTTTLDTTSKYRVVDETDSTHGYTFFTQWSVDRFTNPTKLRLGSHPYGLEGYTMRLFYEAEFTALTTEAATTDAPLEWLELASLARLYLIKASNAPASELKNWGTMYQAMSEAASQYAAKNRYAHLPSTYSNDQSALGRHAPEYPF